MDIERSTSPQIKRGAATAIGNFDGVHLGHQSVIDQARAAATRLGAPLGVLTFEPHPRQFFAPQAPAFRLMNAEARAHRLEKLGVDVLYEVPFDAALAGLSAQEFCRQILGAGLGLRHAVVGADFRFGKDRGGNAGLLAELGAELGFGVTVSPLLTAGALEVSSTAIRRALSEGRPEDAAQMLGHFHRIDGQVQRGDQRGRELGYPTANLHIDALHPPKHGVYAVKADVLSSPHAGSYHGVASCGVRPMFGENAPNFETHLFDFTGDIYGAQISVALVAYLRGEAVFDSIEALIAQMDADSAQARAILADV